MQRSQNNKLLTIPKSSDFRNLSPTLSKGEGEIILSFQNIPSILITPKILSILNFLNFPITPIIPINPINPIIHQKALTEKICKGFDIIILTFSVSSPSPQKNENIEILKNGKIKSAVRFFIIFHLSFII